MDSGAGDVEKKNPLAGEISEGGEHWHINQITDHKC